VITRGRRSGSQTLNVREVVDTTTEVSRCVECGDVLLAERAELGYTYCTKDACQARHHRGLIVTAVGTNKGADTLIVADPDEVRRRGEAGEFTRKDTGLGLDYRPLHADGAARTPAKPAPPRRTPTARPWTARQEKLVRLYHEMGLSPQRIVARARENAPHLAITEQLVTRILSAPPTTRR
jgi:hypothetical protein